MTIPPMIGISVVSIWWLLAWTQLRVERIKWLRLDRGKGC
jgi:hypothetical protein